MVQPAGRTTTALLHARDVFTRAGIHFDDFADLYKQRNFNHSASRQGSRFAASTCGITFQARIGINDFQFNVQPLGIEVNANGKVCGVKMARTEMGQPDAKGRRRAEIVAGSEHVVPADAVVMAFGFRPHSMEWLAKHSVELDSQGRVIAPEGSDNAFQTSNPKIFAGGDIVRGSDLVVTAIAEGRKAADGILNYLEV